MIWVIYSFYFLVYFWFIKSNDVNDFRNRPKDQYIFEADWKELYVLTEHWKSDLLFYKDDLRFLQHLIDKYFLWMSQKENIDLVRDTEVNLMETDKQCDSLLKRTSNHLTHLADLIDDPFKYDSHTFRTEHQALEDGLASFVKTVRENRKEIFKVTEHVVDSEEFVEKLMKK